MTLIFWDECHHALQRQASIDRGEMKSGGKPETVSDILPAIFAAASITRCDKCRGLWQNGVAPRYGIDSDVVENDR
jgi:hypothetical protein